MSAPAAGDGEIQPYAPAPRQLAGGLHVWDGEWFGTPFARRMTLVQLPSGGLWVHNPIRLREEDYARLDALGPVRFIVAPNRFHDSDAPHYKRRYPDARLYAAPGSIPRLRKLCPVDGTLEDLEREPPPELAGAIASLRFEGTRLLEESVFLDRASRTLIVTDLAFHMRGRRRGLERAFFRLNRIEDRFGPSRIFRYGFVRDRARAAASLEAILRWDFDRVIMNHGEILETGGRAALQRGFAEVGIRAAMSGRPSAG